MSMLRSSLMRAAGPSRAAGVCPSVRSSLYRSLHASASSRVLTAFDMPAMSPTMTEGGIADWKLKEGDSFAPGDVLLEVETDKATIDVEAQDEGVLGRILAQNGEKGIPVGKIIAVLGEEGDDFSDAAIAALTQGAPEPPKTEAAEEAPAPKETSSSTSGAAPAPQTSGPAPVPAASSSLPPPLLATPIVKRLALEKGIPLSQIKGSGPNGRIVKADIDGYKPAASGASSASASAPAAAAAAAYTDVPLSSVRRVIASRLSASKQDSPHFYLTMEIELDRVNKLRSLFNAAATEAAAGRKTDVKPPSSKISVNDFIIKAAALALQDVPAVNAGWHGDFIREYKSADISVAVATPTGLITPIIRSAETKGLGSISAEAKALALAARDGKLTPEQYQGGSFTISNLGMMGISHFTAIINPPQGAILAIGAASPKLVLDPASEKGFKETSVMNVTLSCDHRVIDGAVGAQWLQSFKTYLESPLSFML